ncbi:MAG: benzoate-CoA ligase family protein [bacterium]|nr:benzoate-CoA ligase family protein [bacterium]
MNSQPTVFEAPERFNIADYFLGRRIREGRGDKPAIMLDDRQLTYRDVEVLANQFGHVLRRLEVRQEERVLIGLPDGAEFVGALFGILKIGAVAVPINPEIERQEIAGMYELTRCRVAVVHASVVESFAAAAADSRWPAEILVVGSATGEQPSFERERQTVDEELETSPTHRDDPAMWLFSSDACGRPQAVVQRHASFAIATECYAKGTLGYREDDVTISVPKLFFSYALGSNLFFPFALGATSVLYPESPTPEVLFAKIARHRPSILITVPTAVSRMVSDPEAANHDFSSLRFVTSAAEALPASLYHRWKKIFGVELLDGLGTAEMWHIFITNRPDDVRPGTLGRAVPGFEVKICDDDGHEVPDGEVGRLWVRGGSRAIGYWQNMAKTREAFPGDWFVGSDLASRDDEGYITYCGRDDDVLKVGGRWLLPQELEDCLRQHPAVKECVVVGVCDAQGLTKPYAFVVATEPSPELEEDLKDFALEHLHAYKYPRRVILLDALPRTPLGRVDRAKLNTLA